MPRIATLTLNPAVDSACEADQVFPTHKVRTFGQRNDPGGGGINVARVLARLGHEVEAIYLAGGATGELLNDLLIEHGLSRHHIAIAEPTRMSLAVFERSSGKEFRFVPEGPLIADREWQSALEASVAAKCDWLVASGSLPRGVPSNFYARLAHVLTPRGTRLVLDTSGDALSEALAAGGLFVAKPSRGEFEALTGGSFASPAELADAATAFVRAGKVKYLAVTLGHEGAVLAHPGGTVIHPGHAVPSRSATGAGDSFLAGMVHALMLGADAKLALDWGIAAGTAAVLSPGTGLCDPADVAHLLTDLG